MQQLQLDLPGNEKPLTVLDGVLYLAIDVNDINATENVCHRRQVEYDFKCIYM